MTRRMAVLVVLLSATAAPAEPRPAASREAIERDWMLQDYMAIELPAELEREKQQWREKHLTSRESRPDAPVLAKLGCFVRDGDCLVERRMVDRVLAALGEQAAALRSRAEQLTAAGAPGSDGRWRELYVAACELRRERRLRPLLARWRRFVFNKHRHIRTSYKYTEGLSSAMAYRFFAGGSSLNVLEMDGPYGTVRTLLADPGGSLRNPDVSYDGRCVLFAWKKSDRGDDYHLYEMLLASGDVRQLTSGKELADYEGVYLPDGNILFTSTRCIQSVDCNWVEVSNLFLMARDGRSIRRVGFDQVHTIFPTVTDDGRVLYTRWEYNDRGQIYPQPLFQMNPDGTNQSELYGGSSWFPTNIVHGRQIPGTHKVLAIVTGHHMPAHGKLAIIDPGVGRQEGVGVQLVAPVRPTEPIRVDRYALGGNQFQYPWPVSETEFLVALALPTPDGKLGRFDIYFMDTDGRRELLVEGDEPGEGVGCKQIAPLAARPVPHVRPSGVDYRKRTGTFYVQDVYEGLGLRGVRRGTIKRLRVVALEYRCAPIGSAQQSGAGGSSSVTTPIAVANGSWDVKVVLGSATVHEDGSACFQAPARTPVYFQALDANGLAVQTMRSWATLMPGEGLSCVGCHEDKNTTPLARRGPTAAMRAGPQALEPFYGPPRGFSFPKEVQPILDRHCIRCHNSARPGVGASGKPAPFSLTGEAVLMPKMKRRFSTSYLALTHAKGPRGEWDHPVVNWIDCMSGPAMLPPYHRGAATSRLTAMLAAGHNGVRLTREEKEKVACWIDLLVPYCGDYREANVWTPADHRKYDHYEQRRSEMLTAERRGIEELILSEAKPRGGPADPPHRPPGPRDGVRQ
ncbi:MAG TPA: hypothetical protein VM695_00290 [Phycisphaerae bacterium]|nr:hypothetical protein [Phycisphaerae bacterium]